MKPIAAIVSGAAGLVIAAASLSASPAAKADELNELRTDQQTIGERIDQLARPQPQSEEKSGNPAPTAPSPGSFPRSFLIPGTDTSIRIGGSIDGTAGYYGH